MLIKTTIKYLFLYFLLLLLLCSKLSAAENNPLGWVENHKDNLDAVCRSGYLWMPPNDYNKQNIILRAEAVTSKSGTTILSGNIEVVYQNTTLTGDEAIYYKNKNILLLKGNIILQSPHLIARGENIVYKPESKEGQVKIVLEEAEFSQPASHISGTGEQLTQEGSIIQIKDAIINFCDPNENTWHIKSDSLHLNLASQQGSARGAKFYLGDAPVMYFSYLSFPIGDKRQSGFLAPSFNIGGNNGFIYSQAVYFNLAPNYDTTTYIHGIENRGFLLEQNFRWLTSLGRGVFGFGYINHDALLGQSRSSQHFEFSSGLNNGWAGDIAWSEVSDNDYTDDLPVFFKPSGDLALLRQVQFRYADKWLDWSFGLRDYQLIADENNDGSTDIFFTNPYRQLPYTRLGLYSPVAAGFYLSNILDYSYFRSIGYSSQETFSQFNNQRQIAIFNGDNARLHNDLSFAWGYRPYWGRLKSGLNWQLTDYNLDKKKSASEDNTPNRKMHSSFDIDISLLFSTLLKNPKCSCYLTFEPRLYMLLSKQDLDNSAVEANSIAFDTVHKPVNYDYLFNRERYSGLDTDIAEHRIALGFESALIGFQGTDEYRFRFGRIISSNIDMQNNNLLAQSDLNNNLSDPWAADFSWFINPNSYMQFDTTGDQSGINSYGYALHYKGFTPSHKSGISLLYRHQNKRPDQNKADQLYSSFVWYMRPRWSLFGNWRYNLLKNETTGFITGFGYESCCFNTRVGVYQRIVANSIDNRKETALALKFNFVPLGSLGNAGYGSDFNSIEYIYDEFSN